MYFKTVAYCVQHLWFVQQNIFHLTAYFKKQSKYQETYCARTLYLNKKFKFHNESATTKQILNLTIC